MTGTNQTLILLVIGQIPNMAQAKTLPSECLPLPKLPGGGVQSWVESRFASQHSKNLPQPFRRVTDTRRRRGVCSNRIQSDRQTVMTAKNMEDDNDDKVFSVRAFSPSSLDGSIARGFEIPTGTRDV